MKITAPAGIALAIGLALGGVVVTAGAAEAHDKVADVTCTTASVSLTNYDQGATALVILDGVMQQGIHGTNGDAPSGFGGHYVQSWPLTSDATHTSHRLQVTVISTDGAQYNLNYDQTATGCYTAPPPTVTTIPAPTLSVVPPTCDADGTLPFLGNPPAQNPNGYEFPGQGYRVYLSPGFTGPGTYTATIQKVGPGFDPAFPGGTKLTGNTTQTLVVAAKLGHQSIDANAPCYVAPPLTQVSIVPPTHMDATCTAAATYTLYAQPTGVKYALTDQNDPTSRPVAGTFTLADGVSLTVNAHSIAGYVPVSGTWTFTGHAKLASQSTDANAPCYVAPPVVTPTPTDTPVPTAAVAPKVDELAHTNVGDQTIPALIGWGALTGGIALIGAAVALRRKTVR